jgi:Family of unknown function (DUF6056)
MRKLLTPIAVITLAGPMIAALLAHAGVGFFSRYWYDDFITSATLRDKGFLGAQRYWYSNWTGCFSHSIATSLAELVGPSVVAFLPLAALVIWVGATAWAIRPVVALLPEASTHHRSVAIVSALLLVFATANTVPDVVQSFYWQTGILKYLISLILFTTCAGIIGVSLRRGDDHVQWGRVALCALLALLTGGFSEVSAFLEVCGLTVLLVAALTFARKSFGRGSRILILAAFCGAVAALLIVAAAPGNKVRQATVMPSAGWLSSVESSFRYALYFFEQHTRRHRGTTLLSLVLPAWLILVGHYLRNQQLSFAKNEPLYARRRILKLFVGGTAIGFALIVLCFVPGFYAISEPLPGRAQLLPKFLLVCLFVYWGALGGFVLQKASALVRKGALLAGAVALVTLLILSPVAAAWRTFALIPRARAYAAQWDQTERQIRAAAAAGVKDVTVRRVGGNETDLGFGRADLRLGRDPKQPQNWAAALYYGVDSIKAE